MAALAFDLVVADLALPGSDAAKTVLQIIAPSTNKVTIAKGDLEVSFNGTSATDEPVLVQVMRQTTAIGGSPTTVTPKKARNGEAGTIQTTAKASAGGAEPTSSDIYWSGRLHPQGRHVIPKEFVIEQGDRLGVVCAAASTPETNISARCTE